MCWPSPLRNRRLVVPDNSGQTWLRGSSLPPHWPPISLSREAPLTSQFPPKRDPSLHGCDFPQTPWYDYPRKKVPTITQGGGAPWGWKQRQRGERGGLLPLSFSFLFSVITIPVETINPEGRVWVWTKILGERMTNSSVFTKRAKRASH